MAKDGVRPMRSGPKPPLAGAALRKAVMAIWCVCFCGMQWRAIGLLCEIPFGTLYGLFARWTRLGLWRRLLDRLRRTWRRACGDAPEPSAVVIDSRSCTRRRVVLIVVATAERRSGASKSMLRSTNTASRWRSMSRWRTGMTRKVSCRFCERSPRRLPGPSARGSRLPRRAAGQSRRDAWHHRRGDCPWSRWTVRSGRDLLGG